MLMFGMASRFCNGQGPQTQDSIPLENFLLPCFISSCMALPIFLSLIAFGCHVFYMHFDMVVNFLHNILLGCLYLCLTLQEL